MATTGKLEVDVEVKTSPEKFWSAIRESEKLFPLAMPEHFKSIEIVEGDGKTVGSVRLIKYAAGNTLFTFGKEKIDAVDEEKKTVAYSVIDGEILTLYKSFKAQLVVEPKGEGSLVKWSCEYEKAKEDTPSADPFKDIAANTFKELDAYLLKA